MFSLIKLQAKSSLKNPATIMALIMPVLLVAVLGATSVKTNNQYMLLIGNIIAINFIAITMLTFGYTLMEMKKSIIMKRIGSTSITKPKAIMAFFSWASILGLVTVFWTMILATIMSEDVTGMIKANFSWSVINWGSFIYGLIIGTILSLSIGFFFVSITTDIQIFQIITMIYLMANMFLGGLIFQNPPDWMIYVGYILPHKYIAEFMTNVFSGQPVFNLTSNIIGSTNSLVIREDIKWADAVKLATDNDWYLLSFSFPPMDGDIGNNDPANALGTATFIVTDPMGTVSSVREANLNLWIPIGTTIIVMGITTKTFTWD